jgi:hypothetical protein
MWASFKSGKIGIWQSVPVELTNDSYNTRFAIYKFVDHIHPESLKPYLQITRYSRHIDVL